MLRRGFLRAVGATGLTALAWPVSFAAEPRPARRLVLVRLKGGNDGLNTVVPYADPAYYRLRPTLAIRRDTVLQLDHRLGLHPALTPLFPLWGGGEMAVLQGVGYPQPSLSHFRSAEIWESAFDHTWLIEDGVLAPMLASARPTRRAVAATLRTRFPKGRFGRCARRACLALADGSGVRAVRLEIDGFDTHQDQAIRHRVLLGELAEGLSALRAGLLEFGLWDSTLVLTESEFGRRIAENPAAGTDHGTAAVHFALGGQVRGGLYGRSIETDRLDSNGNPEFGIDFRAIYATALERWLGLPDSSILRQRFGAENFLST